MISLAFSPGSADCAHDTDEYSRIWAHDGLAIITAIETLTSLTYKEPRLEVVVFEGMSRSNPTMKLRASYDTDTKKATLIHELLHRLSSEYMLNLPIKDEELTLGLHKQIDLVLYDLWASLYGRKFADEQVRIESGRTQTYKQAWEWALAFSQQERYSKFAQLRDMS